VVSKLIKLRPGRPEFRTAVLAQEICLFENVQTNSGAHPASYSVSTGAFSDAVKRRRERWVEVDNSPPSNPEVKNEWSSISCVHMP
jgi:hypothetical protein